MNSKLATLLKELEEFGKANDARERDRARRMLNIPRATGEFLLLMARAVDARRVLELGTSNGYSTLWLAYAIQPMDGRVVTVERSTFKAELARENFKRVSLEPWIQQHVGEAVEILKQQPDRSFGLVFLDSDRKQYGDWWNDTQRVLAPGGLLVVDNAVSHAEEIADFVELVKQTPGFLTSLVPIGNGEFVAFKEA